MEIPGRRKAKGRPLLVGNTEIEPIQAPRAGECRLRSTENARSGGFGGAERRKNHGRKLRGGCRRGGPRIQEVFIVHGHDGEAKESVARFLSAIGFQPIILHEQPNKGRTIIEKVEAFREVGFAVVLLTPDDEGKAKSAGSLEPRARQNVLFELGYFIGSLGRERVCALLRDEVAIPSDFDGVVWTKMDSGYGWKQALGKELEASGYEIDWNLVMRS